MSQPATQFRWRFPRLKWIVVAAVLLLLVGSGWTGWQMYRQRWALSGIERLGGSVLTEPGGPDWLRRWVGPDWMKPFDTVVSVYSDTFTGSNDEFEPYLRVFPTRPELIITETRK